MHATSLLNAVLGKYRGTVHTTRFIRDRELGRRADVSTLNVETLKSHINEIDESFEHLDDTVRKRYIDRIIVPTLLNGTKIRKTLEHKELHEAALSVLGKVVETNPKMVTPHVGVLVAMLQNKYEHDGQDEPDEEELESVLSILGHIFRDEPNEINNYVKELLVAMTIEDVDQAWRNETLNLLIEVGESVVDWDLYFDEICTVLETDGNDEEPEFVALINQLSLQIRPEVYMDEDFKLQLVRVE